MNLRVFNSLSGTKEEFVPLEGNRVRMYVCGVTVYDYCHVGHARAAVVFDTIFRYLKHKGFDPCFVRNFTDIDDKIIMRAQESGIPWQEVTRKFIDAFYEDMGQLNIAAPTVEPKATDHIPEMIAMIRTLVEKGIAYESGGDVFYSIQKVPGYGRLSGKKTDDLRAGARVDVNESKRDPLDFALWKKSKPGEPFWESPWGPGRPGWHIECSAMSSRYLGETFDIHGGGKDLIFPHHENEIAQSCGCSGKQPVRYWIHNGFVNIDQEKMSKSLGNFFTIRDIYKQFHPESLRLFLLSNHYRSPIDFSRQNLEEAEKVLTRFYEALGGAAETQDPTAPLSGLDPEVRAHPLWGKFAEAMDDDFNTAVVLAHLNEELRALNKSLADACSGVTARRQAAVSAGTLRRVGGVIGLFQQDPAEFKKQIFAIRSQTLDVDVEKIESLITSRNSARKARQWADADRFRDELIRMGVALEDTPNGTEWKLK